MKYFAFPQKVIPIYLNVTELQTSAYIGSLLLAGVGKSVSQSEFQEKPKPTKQSLTLQPDNTSPHLPHLTALPHLVFFQL